MTVEQDASTPDALKDAICRHLRYSLARECDCEHTPRPVLALALTARDQMVDGMFATEQRYAEAKAKRLYYLSMEFLMGRTLGNTLHQPGPVGRLPGGLKQRGADLDEVREREPDAALGNGGLGRLAACFLDSLATLGMPGFGYGINYEYGLFRQEIQNGYQIEKPDNWLAHGTPWEIERPDEACPGARLRAGRDARRTHGQYRRRSGWTAKPLIGVPHDMPIVGYGGPTVNYPAAVFGAVVAGVRHAGLQRGRLSAGGGPADRDRDASPKSCTRRTSRRRAKSCGCCRSISWSPAPSMTSSAATGKTHDDVGTSFPIRSRSR